MIATLVPEGVIVVEAEPDDWTADLWPEELAAVAGAIERRRQEFAAGRACARRALVALGLEPAAIPVGPNREPLWPDEVVGSITHTGTHRYCAVALTTPGHTQDLVAIGIDVEVNQRLTPDVAEIVCSPAEQRRHRELGRLVAPDGGATVDTASLAFAAKEAVYKAWFPLTRVWLDFSDVTIEPADDGTFAVSFLPSAPNHALAGSTQFSGRWAATADLIFTAVAARPATR